MNRIFFITSLLAVLLAKSIFSQQFIEITTGEWGGDEVIGENIVIYDIDNDGFLDALTGQQDGTIDHFEQVSETDGSKFSLVTSNFNGIDVGDYSYPTIIDIDNDGLIELVIGRDNGRLSVYKQLTYYSYDFYLFTYNLSEIDDGNRSVPAFADINNNGLLDLFIGNYDGYTYYYEQLEVNSFTFDYEGYYFDVGYNSAPTLFDVDNDGLMDLIIGENSGNLNHYEQTDINSTSFTSVTSDISNINVGYSDYYAAPIFTDLDNDGFLDLMIGEADDNINHYSQDNINSYDFSLVSSRLIPDNVNTSGGLFKPCITDFDNDGLLDLLIGDDDSYMRHYEQSLSDPTDFQLVTLSFSGINVGDGTRPAITDFDNDGLLDLLIGESYGTIDHYEQAAPMSTVFLLITENFNGIDVGYKAAPSFTDFDNDGLIDLIIGADDGRLEYYEQSAVGSEVFNLITTYFNSIDIGQASTPDFSDIDNNGLIDLLIGDSDGILHHYEQATVNSDSFDLITSNFLEKDFGTLTTPFCYDIDGNGFDDILIGELWDRMFLFMVKTSCVTLIEPEDDAVESLVSPSFVWNCTPGVDGYLFCIGTDNPPSNILNSFDVGLDTIYSPDPLQMDQTYYWMVKSYTAADTSENCEIRSFNIIAAENLPYTELNNSPIISDKINLETDLTNSDVWSLSKSSNAGGVNFEFTATNAYEIGVSRLILPAVYTVGLSEISFQFDQFFDDLVSGMEMRLESSSDGINWTPESWSQLSGSGNIGPSTVTTVIINNVGSATYISLVLIGDHNSFNNWYIDNFYIFNANDVPPASFPILPNSFSVVTSIDTLKWYETPNTDTYQLFVGTDNPPTNIHNGQILTEPFYPITNISSIEDTLYWKVIPSNTFGNTVDTDSWRFLIDPSDFLWGKAINYSHPLFTDIENDGRLDLIIGATNHLEHYVQSETNPDNFELVSTHFNNIELTEQYNQYIHPVSIDIDNDGLLDLFIGEREGKVSHYAQESSKSSYFNLITENFNEIDIGYSSAPAFTDVDKDGLLDLFIGEQDGNLNHYEQVNKSLSTFELITGYFDNIEVDSYSVPTFVDIDHDGLLDLYIGTGDDGVERWEQHSSNPLNFIYSATESSELYSSPTFTDLDNDGFLDKITGNRHGKLIHYEQPAFGSLTFDSITNNLTEAYDVGSISNPVFLDIDNNNLLDMLISGSDVYHYEATSNNSFEFNLISSNFSWIDAGGRIAVTDLDHDGLIDLVLGSGRLHLYEQVASNSLIFNLVTDDLLGTSISYSSAAIADIDDDGLLDILVGENNGRLHHYEQSAYGSISFVVLSNYFNGIDVGGYASPYFYDTDYDGLLDLIIGDYDGNVHRYEQDASGSYTFLLSEMLPLDIPVSTRANPTITDIDNNGIYDLVVGDNTGGIYLTKLDLPCTLLNFPEDEQTDVVINTSLTWFSSLAADGYALSLGTDNPPTNILNLVDVGTDTVYIPSTELEYSQTYYWQVDVYKGNDTTSGCAVRSFTTMSFIDIPYTVSIEDCLMPSGWIQESTTDSTIWSVQYSNIANGIPCELQAQSINASGISRLILPALPTSAVDTLVVQFNQFFDDVATGLDLKIESSTDGENWTAESWQQQSGSGDIGPVTESLEITNNLGDYTFISFTIEGDHNSFDSWYLDDIFIYDKHGIPPCTYPIQPENGMIVLEADTLKWKQTPITDNFKFFIGTDFPPTNIYNDSTVTSTFFVPDVILPVNDTIYWQVIPSNQYGEGQACESWSFYIEFEGVFPPSNLQAEIQDYFDVYLSWSEPLPPVEDSVLIVDLDDNFSSGPEIYNLIASHGIPVLYSTTFPVILDDYAAIFVCLGVFSNNHVLSPSEGQLLADYLNNGGNLYMEGNDTWAFDTQTPVHPLFNIDGVAIGTSDMNIVNGLPGTFAEGMSFNYSGENNYMDHLEPLLTAVKILENQSPNYGTGIAYDAGTYKTIGTSHEFGGLDDGVFPSTKEELMTRYLNYFGINNSKSSGQKAFLGYNVYRNGIKVNTEPISNLFYDDLDLLPDTYNYYVTTLYDEGESSPSNIETALIEDHNLLDLKVFLEGPYYEGEMTPYLNAFNYIPLNQPYFEAPWNYNGFESVPAIPNGEIIDWILVELRETSGDAATATSSTIIAQKACFLLLDGSIVDSSGQVMPDFKVPVNENLYVVIHHRNHLSIMSSIPLTSIDHVYTYDFSDSETKVHGGNLGHKQLDSNIWGMSSGDGNADKQINIIDKNDIWFLHYGEVGYFTGDFDMNSYDYLQDIIEKWRPNSGKSSQVPD